jgi:2-oxoglutarate dehydrogenase E2 component (dihydrolipoamide succinyltransferase)
MDIKIPEIGESILEALIANWLKQDGDYVNKDELLCELETDKINVELNAEVSGILHISVPEGTTVDIGAIIGSIDEKGTPPEESPKESASEPPSPVQEEPQKPSTTQEPAVNPAARQKAAQRGIDITEVTGSGRGGRVTLDDVLNHAQSSKQPDHAPTAEKPATEPAPKAAEASPEEERPHTREAMSPIRQRIAARLLQARQQTAMLTTFNEADMTWVKKLRSRHQEHFTKKHGVKLGMMSFFVKACIEALKEYPAVNARIDGTDIVYHHFYDIGIAVGTDRGLVVPVLRNADQLTFASIEQKIADLAEKANTRKLTLADLEGGTFTITNGGIYGSLLSTPILNPPQCGVLGMHSIQDRAVVVDGEIVIRPMMNLALSYDHRLIDGREAVGFLKLVKEYIEDPSELFLEL